VSKSAIKSYNVNTNQIEYLSNIYILDMLDSYLPPNFIIFYYSSPKSGGISDVPTITYPLIGYNAPITNYGGLYYP
jgi:hypothetical protein